MFPDFGGKRDERPAPKTDLRSVFEQLVLSFAFLSLCDRLNVLQRRQRTEARGRRKGELWYF
jgi:hypothetical protein